MTRLTNRVLEPEVMDTAEEARDYNAMDHSEVNRRFVDDFLRVAPEWQQAQLECVVLDVGTGTALIPIQWCQKIPHCRMIAIDLASEMLRLGEANIQQAGLGSRVTLQRVDAKGMPYGEGQFAAVISNSIIHHIPEPVFVWREMWRVLAPGGYLFVRDLLRPEDEAQLKGIVEQHAAGANEHQRKMFADSLRAALSLDELRTMLEAVGIPGSWAAQTSDRHWTVAGRKSAG